MRGMLYNTDFEGSTINAEQHARAFICAVRHSLHVLGDGEQECEVTARNVSLSRLNLPYVFFFFRPVVSASPSVLLA